MGWTEPIEGGIETVVETARSAEAAAGRMFEEVMTYIKSERSKLAHTSVQTTEGATLRRDGQGQLSSVTSPSGRSLEFSTANGSLQHAKVGEDGLTISRSNNGTWLMRDAQGNISRLREVSVDDARGDLHYVTEEGTKVSVLSNGATITESKNTSWLGDEVTSRTVVHGNGDTWKFTYMNDDKNPTLVETPNGHIWNIHGRVMDSNGNLYVDFSMPSSDPHGYTVARGLTVGPRGEISYTSQAGLEAPDGSLLQVMKPFVEPVMNREQPVTSHSPSGQVRRVDHR